MNRDSWKAKVTKMSYRIKLDPKSRKAARFISQLQKKLQKAFISSGKTQQEVATALGIDRSVINRRLSGSANLTARSIAELAHAINKEVQIEFVDRARHTEVNYPISEEDSVYLPQRSVEKARGNIDPNVKFNIEKTAA